MPDFRLTKDAFTQNLAMGRIVVPYLESFDQLDEEWTFTYKPKEHDDAWHPSGDCLPSPMELYNKTQTKKRKKLSPATQRNFMVGHFWHAVIQRILCDKLGFCSPEDVERLESRSWGSDPYHWVRGAGDIAPLTMPNWTGVLDIKTMSSSMWKASQKNGLLPPQFADKYEAQVNIYMELFDQDEAIIVGVNKDAPHGFIEFRFQRNQDLIDMILDKWLYISECLDKGQPPRVDTDMAFPLDFKGPIG